MDDGVAITADVRLDNRSELIEKLDLDKLHRPITDSSLVLAAYRKWDLQCPKELLGDFAFAIWDERKRRFFCARDHFGVKPFYYYFSDNLFLFASEIKALFVDPRVPKRLDEIRIGDHLALLSSDPEITFYRDIRRLPPGHSMTMNREGIRLEQYWSLDPDRELRFRSDEEYAEALRDIFMSAVGCRLRSAYPIASFLSGGLDSSSITCAARELLARSTGSSPVVISAVFDRVSECDERPYIEEVLRHIGLPASYVHADCVSPLSEIGTMLWHQDQVVTAGNLYINWSLYEQASSRGVRVLLDGFDGDTSLSHGTGYLVELARANRWFALAREVKAYSNKLKTPWFNAYWAWIQQYALRPVTTRFGAIRQLRQFGAKILRPDQRSKPILDTWQDFLNPAFVRRTGLAERRQQARGGAIFSERQKHHRLLTWAMIPDTLEALDKVGAAFSVEPRYPFWDKRIAEFCLALPSSQKMRRGWTRWIMRRAMEGLLPKTVQWRCDKSDLGPSLDKGLLAFEGPRLEQLRLGNFESLQEYIDVASLRRAYDRFMTRTATELEALMVWRSLSLAVWLQHMRSDQPPLSQWEATAVFPPLLEKGGDTYGAT
jgi:asparagine synthase (glutamine-hydrolysing)